MAIGIIAVLAGLLVSVLSRAKNKAQRIQCVSNLRQQGIAMQGFVTEYHFYPLYRNVSYSANGYPGGIHSWRSALEKWEMSGKGRKELRERAEDNWKNTVWHCPSTPDSSLTFGTATLTTTVWVRGYGYNAYGLRRFQDPDSLGLGEHKGNTPDGPVFSTPIKESEVVAPGNMMAIGDAFIGGSGVIVDTQDRLQRTSDLKDKFGSTKRSFERHRGKANVVFVDGHVESPTLKAMFEDTTDVALSRWNRDNKPHRERISQ